MSAEEHYIMELERDNRNLTQANESLRAQLAALQAQVADRQEPVAIVTAMGTGVAACNMINTCLPTGTKLYARPVPCAERSPVADRAAVPDDIKREVEYVTMCLDGYVADQSGPTETMAQAADLIRRMATQPAAVPEGCMWDVTKGGHTICQPPRGPAAVPDAGKLWSFLRNVLQQGGAISQDHADAGYEQHSARLDAAARERAEQLTAMITAAQESK